MEYGCVRNKKIVVIVCSDLNFYVICCLKLMFNRIKYDRNYDVSFWLYNILGFGSNKCIIELK